jgi:hypothetical protein
MPRQWIEVGCKINGSFGSIADAMLSATAAQLEPQLGAA